MRLKSSPVGCVATHPTHLEINCHGGQVTTVHNGAIVTNISESTVPALALRLQQGYLGLQNHSTRVAFRNLRLGPALEFPAP
ncbi:MAG: family 16 glycoside hydrolase [Planctomycetaceae bacterium]